jgi:beta-galactosidase GanA
MSKKHFADFVIGTQYYRAPTPLPEEWEYDLENMENFSGIDTIQLRIQWRWNEPAEGDYRFADIDRLFDLAAQYHKKVIVKFLMECAPDYIFHKYGGHRRDMQGALLRPGAHGAYYVGGWIPCFDNPEVIRKAEEFVRVVVKRYQNRPELVLWNVWNEQRSRPIQECGCEHSNDAYRQWLHRTYGTVEALNQMFGKAWESFDTVEPPAMPHDYAELFIWRKWSLDAVRARLTFMYQAIAELDATRPIISHVGACSVIQDAAGDGSDDVLNNEEVDFYGTSYGSAQTFVNHMQESKLFLTCDWLRRVSPYYWVYELYPDWGNWTPRVTVSDFLLKFWSTVAGGAKGIVYWQYRAERLGCENDLAGLLHMDGRPKDITGVAREAGKAVMKHSALLMQAEVKDDAIGIFYDVNSDLINRIENTGGGNFWNFELRENPYHYKQALSGIYALFRELGHAVRWVDECNLARELSSLKLLYLPQAFMLSESSLQLLEEFAARGGHIIAEEGCALRQENTWLHPVLPSPRAAALWGACHAERVSVIHGGNTISVQGEEIPAEGYVTRLTPAKDAEIIGYWRDGAAAAVRRGTVILLGTSLGASFHQNFEETAHLRFLRKLLDDAGFEARKLPRGVYLRELVAPKATVAFYFNRSAQPQEIRLPVERDQVELIWDQSCSLKSGTGVTALLIEPGGVAAIILSSSTP